MRCKNCGGIINGTEVICPFCGWENELLADHERAREIARVTEKTRDFFAKPEKAAHQASYIMYRVIAAILILFVLSIVTIYCVNQLQSKDKYHDQQKVLSELEVLYVAGDFEAMEDLLLSDADFRSASFTKYNIVARLYNQVSLYEYVSPSFSDHVARYPEDAETLDSDFKVLFGLLGECEQMKVNGYVYGEEAVLTDFSLRTKVLLQDYFLLTDEEILQGTVISKNAIPDYTELRDISASRLSGGAE